MPASPQQQAPAPPDVIRINVNMVEVDAVVTDSKGKVMGRALCRIRIPLFRRRCLIELVEDRVAEE
jgi:hypothetical protein